MFSLRLEGTCLPFRVTDLPVGGRAQNHAVSHDRSLRYGTSQHRRLMGVSIMDVEYFITRK